MIMTMLVVLMMLATSWAEPISALSLRSVNSLLSWWRTTPLCVLMLVSCWQPVERNINYQQQQQQQLMRMMEGETGTEPMWRTLLLLWDKPNRVSTPPLLSVSASATPAVDGFLDGLWGESGGRDNRAEVPWELDQRNRVDMAYKHGRRTPRLGPEQ